MKTLFATMALIPLLILSACGRPSTATTIPNTEDVPGMGTESLPTDPTLAPEATTQVPYIGDPDAGRLAQWYGFQVYGSQSETVGTPHDLVLNFDTDIVEYVVIDVDASGQLVAVPWSSMALNTSAAAQNQNSFVYGGGPDQLSTAGAFNASSVPPLGQSAAGWDAEMRSFWGLTPSPQQTTTAEAPTGQTLVDLQGVVLASGFIGRSVQTSDGQIAGTVDDLVIDAQSGQIRYIVINTTNGSEPGLILVPVNALAWDPNNASLALVVEQTVFIAAPFYTLETFPNTQQPDWDAELRTYWQGYVP